jgi:hypothetical protein
MRKLVFIFLVSIANLKAQVPADSLIGTYVGLYYYASPSSGAWIITADTEYVSNVDTNLCIKYTGSVDTVDCKIHLYGCINFYNGCYPSPFYTTYSYCNNQIPSNGFILFYNSDSLKIIHDNIPLPPPNNSYSVRFYGKRVNGLITGENVVEKSEVLIYPNPCTNKLVIKSSHIGDLQIRIIDQLAHERKVDLIQSFNGKYELDISDLSDGFYIFFIDAGETEIIKKIIVNNNN